MCFFFGIFILEYTDESEYADNIYILIIINDKNWRKWKISAIFEFNSVKENKKIKKQTFIWLHNDSKRMFTLLIKLNT